MPSASAMSRRNGLTALAQRRRTRSSVSLLFSVVRSMQETARSSHAAWLSPLMLRRLVSDATRRSSALRLTLRIDSRKPRSSAMPGLRAMPWPLWAGALAGTREGSDVTELSPASATAFCIFAAIFLPFLPACCCFVRRSARYRRCRPVVFLYGCSNRQPRSIATICPDLASCESAVAMSKPSPLPTTWQVGGAHTCFRMRVK